MTEKVLKKHLTPHMLRHSSANYWAAKMNRYQFCAKYGWAFSSDMPDRYIERKVMIFNQIAQRRDVGQTTRLQKKNRVLIEKVERLGEEYDKLRKASEFIMCAVEGMETEDLKKKIFEKRKKELSAPTGLPPS